MKTQFIRTAVLLLVVNLDQSPLMITVENPRIQGNKGIGVGYMYNYYSRFFDFLLLKNKNSVNTDSCLAPAS